MIDELHTPNCPQCLEPLAIAGDTIATLHWWCEGCKLAHISPIPAVQRGYI